MNVQRLNLKEILMILLFYSFLLASCDTQKRINYDYVDRGGYLEMQAEMITAKVYKITSLEYHYLIYAQQGRNRYRILSRKQKINECNPVQLDSTYVFILKKDMDAWTSCNESRCIGNTKVPFKEGRVIGLYYPYNMKGLCVFSTEIFFIK
jgi:hypothetical protein